jgi:hypothetical protein
MSRHFSAIARGRWFLTWLVMLAVTCPAAQAPDLKLEALLVWGTNERTSPDANHKPVGPKLKSKLEELPLKWSNYFEVKRIRFDVSPSGSNKVPLSEKCELVVKNLGHSKIEVTVYGKGKQCATRTQELTKEDTLILGGNAPGATSWFAVLRRAE